MQRFQRLQFLEQPVVFGIGDLRRVERVVLVRVVLQLLAQACGVSGGIVHRPAACHAARSCAANDTANQKVLGAGHGTG
jgi:hypothetical protein